jgi:hypothetical protein
MFAQSENRQQTITRKNELRTIRGFIGGYPSTYISSMYFDIKCIFAA